MFTGRRPLFLIAGGSTLCCLLLLSLSGRRLLAGQKEVSRRNWTVEGTKPTIMVHVQRSASNVIPCRVVSFRSKDESLDNWGKLAVYPVVKAPNGKIYRGFVRQYEAASIGSRMIKWTFPTQFRSEHSEATSETTANYGDALTDQESLAKILPPGNYEVKWVFNQRLVDNYDHFHYQYRVIEQAP